MGVTWCEYSATKIVHPITCHYRFLERKWLCVRQSIVTHGLHSIQHPCTLREYKLSLTPSAQPWSFLNLYGGIGHLICGLDRINEWEWQYERPLRPYRKYLWWFCDQLTSATGRLRRINKRTSTQSVPWPIQKRVGLYQMEPCTVIKVIFPWILIATASKADFYLSCTQPAVAYASLQKYLHNYPSLATWRV